MKSWRRRKRYAVTVIALLTLVFAGIGTVLAVLSTSVLRPLPFDRPGELFRLLASYSGSADLWSADDLRRLTGGVPEVRQVALMTPMERRDVRLPTGTVSANVTVMSGNLFATLGIRTTAPVSAPGAAVVSTRLAARLGLSADDLVGRSVNIGGRAVRVVAIIDRSRAHPADGEIWYVDDLPGPVWFGIVRMRGDMHVNGVGDRMSREFQRRYTGSGYVRVMASSLVAGARPAMAGTQRMLLAGLAVFAVIAILNYGLLGIGEARRRAHEFAVRVAVGGTRAQVRRGLLLDQLALVGAALVLSSIAMALVALKAYDPSELVQAVLHLPPPIWAMLTVSLALLGLAAALPVSVSSGTSEIEVLRRVTARGSRFEKIWNRAFVSLQFGVTSFLLVVAGVVLLGFLRDRNASYGFDATNAVIAKVDLSSARQEPGQASLLVEAFRAQVERAFPGRATVWTGAYRTMAGGQYQLAIDPGDLSRSRARYPLWMAQDVSPNFFDVMRIPIVAGRGFTEADDADAAPVIMVTARAARNLWGTTDVIGHRIRFGEDDGTWRTVVGVVADAFPIYPEAFNQQARGAMWSTSFAYRPLAQTFPRGAFRIENGTAVGFTTGFSVIVRHAGLDATGNALRSMLDRVAPGEKFRVVETLERHLDRSGEVERGAATMRILFIFGFCGLALGVIGAMILIDDVVRSRTTEFGIRRALGAQSPGLIALASRETLFAGIGGVLAGALIGARLGPVVSVWLKGTVTGRLLPLVPVSWPLVLATVVVLVLALAAGTTLRALRAARLDPARALRTT